jgi:ubiquinone biosynthesis protein COQ9
VQVKVFKAQHGFVKTTLVSVYITTELFQLQAKVMQYSQKYIFLK